MKIAQRIFNELRGQVAFTVTQYASRSRNQHGTLYGFADKSWLLVSPRRNVIKWGEDKGEVVASRELFTGLRPTTISQMEQSK